MSLSTQPYKGTRDFFPREMRLRRFLFDKFSEILKLYGYQEYDGPMLESFDLYAAKTGEEIVQNQLYHFEDRGGRRVALRPEMTPTLARMVASQIEELARPVRWFSFPNLWRYERPQRGRVREHWQLNVDILGGLNPDSELEILRVAAEILKALGALAHVEFRVNSRSFVNRVFQGHLGLDSGQALAVSKLLDAKEKMSSGEYYKRLQDLALPSGAQAGLDAYIQLDLESARSKFACQEVEDLAFVVESLNGDYGCSLARFDPSIMRGLDYYTGIVFEAFDRSPENPRAMFGGGRYDNLMALFHPKKQLSGVGFGMGDVVLTQFLETHGLLPPLHLELAIYLGFESEAYKSDAFRLAEELRHRFKLSVVVGQEAQKVKSILKSANREGARTAAWISGEERERGGFVIKDLVTGVQEELQLDGYASQPKFLDLLRSVFSSAQGLR